MNDTLAIIIILGLVLYACHLGKMAREYRWELKKKK